PGQLREVRITDEAESWRRRLGLTDWHLLAHPQPLSKDPDPVPRTHLPERLLPLPRTAHVRAAALGLALDRRRPNLDDLDVEQFLDGLPNLRLVRTIVGAE